MAIRAASIWRFVTYAGVMAWMPNSPNDTVVPPVAWPVRPGWCCLRCLTLRGISMITPLLLLVLRRAQHPHAGRGPGDGRHDRHRDARGVWTSGWPARERVP